MAVSEPTGTGTGTTTEFVLCEKGNQKILVTQLEKKQIALRV